MTKLILFLSIAVIAASCEKSAPVAPTPPANTPPPVTLTVVEQSLIGEWTHVSTMNIIEINNDTIMLPPGSDSRIEFFDEVFTGASYPGDFEFMNNLNSTTNEAGAWRLCPTQDTVLCNGTDYLIISLTNSSLTLRVASSSGMYYNYIK